jgi:hypothetical protein
MIRVSKKTRLRPNEVVERASLFFGKGGEELKETERGDCCISFEGTGGYVTVSIVDEEKHRVVDVEAREFEFQAKRFVEML